MDVLYTVLGAVLVPFGLNDVFHNLLYPSCSTQWLSVPCPLG